MNDLINIKVIQKDFDGEKKRFVNARELHSWLGVGKRFATWITDRIKKYDFVEDLDYFITIPNSGNGLKYDKTGKIIIAIAKSGNGLKPNRTGKIIDSKTGRVLPKEYILSVDMAKELAMIENSEIGKMVRKYLKNFRRRETGKFIKNAPEILWRLMMRN